MMKLLYFANRFRSFTQPVLSRVLFYSTKTKTKTRTFSPSKDTLYKRISPLGDPRVSIEPVLDKWIEEGKVVEIEELQRLIRQLRSYRRFKHALEISQWMSDRKSFNLSPGDLAIRLDLIYKVNGLEQAEKHFDNIPKEIRVFQIYVALLNCYAREKSIEKAETLVQEMEELGFMKTPMAYTALLNLYFQVEQYDKLDTLMEEMKEKSIHQDKYTFSIRLSAYAATSDINGMTKILKSMEADPNVIMDWNSYAIAADGYIKAGLIDEALEILKISEGLVTGRKRRVAYDFFLTLYSRTGRKDELYRIWNLYKSSEKLYNTAYLCMMSSLLKLDDIEGAEKILEEWESRGTTYDLRIPNLLIGAYCKKGLLQKAETLITNKVLEKGKKPNANTWNCLATGYLEDNQLPKAVEMMKAAILASKPGWKPNCDTLAACLEYMKGHGDVEGAEELVRLLGALDDGKPESDTVNGWDGLDGDE